MSPWLGYICLINNCTLQVKTRYFVNCGIFSVLIVAKYKLDSYLRFIVTPSNSLPALYSSFALIIN